MYSILSLLKILFLFWSEIWIFELVLMIIPKDWTFLDILTSPNGNTIDLLFIVDRLLNFLFLSEGN